MVVCGAISMRKLMLASRLPESQVPLIHFKVLYSRSSYLLYPKLPQCRGFLPPLAPHSPYIPAMSAKLSLSTLLLLHLSPSISALVSLAMFSLLLSLFQTRPEVSLAVLSPMQNKAFPLTIPQSGHIASLYIWPTFLVNQSSKFIGLFFLTFGSCLQMAISFIILVINNEEIKKQLL